jgi:cytochrome c
MKHNWTKLQSKTRLTMLAGAVFAMVVSSTAIGTGIATAAVVRDPGRGRDAFEKRCAGCHGLDKVRVGPPLRGVYGRAAGKDPHFAYSDALKNSPVMWNEATLDRWLTDTESVVPDNDMAFRLNDPADRADIIAYLRQLSGK